MIFRSLYPSVALIAVAAPGITAPALPTEAQLAEFEKAAEKAVKASDAAALFRLYKLDGVPETSRDLLAFQISIRLGAPEQWGGIKFRSLEDGLTESPESNVKAYRSMVEDRKINGRRYALNGTPVGFVTFYYQGRSGSVSPVGFDNKGQLQVLDHRPIDVDETLYRLPAAIPAQGMARTQPSSEAIERFKEAASLAIERGEPVPGYTKGVPADMFDRSTRDEQTMLGGGVKPTEVVFAPASASSERDQNALKIHQWGERTYGLNLPFAGYVSIAVPSEHGKTTAYIPVGVTPEGELRKVYPVPVIPPSKE